MIKPFVLIDPNKGIIVSLFFSTTILTKLSNLCGNGISPIERKWWDDDYKSKRVGKTFFKGEIKGIFIALLINFIFYLLFYIFGINKFYIGFIPTIPILLFINIQDGGDIYDSYFNF